MQTSRAFVSGGMVLGVMGVLGATMALQPGAPAVQQPAAPVAPLPTAKPGLATETPMYEAPDGTKLPVVSTSEIKLLIEDLKIGAGAEAKSSSTITIHYHGTLMNGKVFDSTRGQQPATFPLAKLIEGWKMGIPGMKVGGIRRLTVPWQLAYGDRAVGDDIPAKSDLISRSSSRT